MQRLEVELWESKKKKKKAVKKQEAFFSVIDLNETKKLSLKNKNTLLKIRLFCQTFWFTKELQGRALDASRELEE